MKSIYKILMIAFILLLVMDNAFAGGGNRTGTGGAAQLLIPVGTRGIAMGEANVSIAGGVDALFWNPAGVAGLNNSASVFFSHMSYIADIGVEYGAVSANFEGFGIISFSVKSLSAGKILVTTTQDPDGTGQTFSPQHLVAGITYSRQLTERIAIGVTTNLVTETLGEVSATGVAFNIGVIYSNLVDVPGLSFGVVMKNIGPQMKYSGSGLLYSSTVSDLHRAPGLTSLQSAPFELPSTFELGAGYKPKFDEQNSIQFAGSFVHNNFSGDEYKAGAEYSYDNMFFLRAGYTGSPKDQSEDYIFGFNAGLGVGYQFQGIDIKADYTFRSVKYFDANHIFSLSLGF
jgi:hypothetical protein